jgi:hypothetical protein
MNNNKVACQIEEDKSDSKTRKIVKEMLLELLNSNAIRTNRDIRGTFIDNSFPTRRSLWENIRRALRDSIADSTAHGFPKIFKTQRILNQLMWIAFFTFYAGVCAWYVHFSTQLLLLFIV